MCSVAKALAQSQPIGRQATGIMAKPNKSNVYTITLCYICRAKAGTLLVDMQGQRQLGPRAVCYLLTSGEYLQKNSN